MIWCPQIGGGSIAQFPLRRKQTWRAISNELENGEWIGLPDSAATRIEWRLSYRDLSDDEAARLRAAFVAAKGSAVALGFADPLANLLAWSEDLARPDWQTGLLIVTQGSSDPLGTNRAWTVSNGSPGTQAVSQMVGIPGDYVGCFSVWLRMDNAGTVFLQRDGVESAVSVGPVWKQAFVSGAGTAASTHSTVSLVLAPGQRLDVWGLQFEAQPYASQYKPTTVPTGIYPETYFANDELTMTSTGTGLTSCEITLVSRV
jgi:hypothetical protein